MQAHDTESLSEQIAKHISEQIIRGELVEGERIQELRIAAELDVSRGSVREALLLLERTHLIEIYPRRGAIVSEMSAQQVRALFDTSSLLLGQIVQRIAETWRSYEAERLQLLLDELGNQLKQGSIEKFYDLIFEGLARQHEMVGNAYLMKFYQELLPSIRRSYFLTLNTSRRELQESYDLFKLQLLCNYSNTKCTVSISADCDFIINLLKNSIHSFNRLSKSWINFTSGFFLFC